LTTKTARSFEGLSQRRIFLILVDFVVLLFLPKPSTNFARINEWEGANSYIRGLFVDGLRPYHKINQNQNFLTVVALTPKGWNESAQQRIDDQAVHKVIAEGAVMYEANRRKPARPDRVTGGRFSGSRLG
jgi:hypothetical protein